MIDDFRGWVSTRFNVRMSDPGDGTHLRGVLLQPPQVRGQRHVVASRRTCTTRPGSCRWSTGGSTPSAACDPDWDITQETGGDPYSDRRSRRRAERDGPHRSPSGRRAHRAGSALTHRRRARGVRGRVYTQSRLSRREFEAARVPRRRVEPLRHVPQHALRRRRGRRTRRGLLRQHHAAGRRTPATAIASGSPSSSPSGSASGGPTTTPSSGCGCAARSATGRSSISRSRSPSSSAPAASCTCSTSRRRVRLTIHEGFEMELHQLTPSPDH